jgi:hypothetical protein
MYPRRGEVRPEFPAQLEADVMSRYENLYSQRRKWAPLLNPRNRIGRYAMGSLLAVALIGVACEMPTSTPVEMGHRVNVQFAAADPTWLNGSLDSELRAALAAAGAEKIEVSVRSTDDGSVQMDVLVWGQHVSRDEVERLIEQHVGEEHPLSVNVQALTGKVSETLGKRIGRRLFDIEVSGETAEELRAAILEQLAEQGFDGSVVVDVQDDGKVRKITVEAGTTDGSREVADEVIIDRRDN